MEVTYERGAIQALMEQLASIWELGHREQDQRANQFVQCRQRYTRLHTEWEQKLRRAQNARDAAESEVRMAEREYSAAMGAAGGAENDEERRNAYIRAQSAMERLERAREEEAAAGQEIRRAQRSLERLTTLWESHGTQGERALRQMESHLSSYSNQAERSNQDLNTYIATMEKARSALYEEQDGSGRGTGAGAASDVPAGQSTAAIPTGWCARNSLRSVSVGAGGIKTFSMLMGGRHRTFPCSKSGAARAYREALRQQDEDLIARTSALFEIETLREDLELTQGDPDTVQLGGYHRDVRTQDPKGYESHHIPASSVQDISAEWLPTVSITREDHKDTSSYAGRQNHVHKSYLPDKTPSLSYKQSMSQKVGDGSSGYVEAVRNELYDLRIRTGHRYDGGISAYLDGVVDLIASEGIPGNK